MKRLAVGQFVVEWVAKRTNEQGNFGAARGIGLQAIDTAHAGRVWKLVAGVAYCEWNGVNVVCHIASEGRNWATREYLRVIFDYPFNQLKAKRITVCVGEGNSASRRFVQHLGFEQEATLTGAHPSGDLLIYVMRKPQCRWLELRKHHEERMAA